MTLKHLQSSCILHWPIGFFDRYFNMEPTRTLFVRRFVFPFTKYYEALVATIVAATSTTTTTSPPDIPSVPSTAAATWSHRASVTWQTIQWNKCSLIVNIFPDLVHSRARKHRFSESTLTDFSISHQFIRREHSWLGPFNDTWKKTMIMKKGSRGRN